MHPCPHWRPCLTCLQPSWPSLTRCSRPKRDPLHHVWVVEGSPVHDTVAAVTPDHGEAVGPERAHDLDLIELYDALAVVPMTRAARVGSTQPGSALRARVACVCRSSLLIVCGPVQAH